MSGREGRERGGGGGTDSDEGGGGEGDKVADARDNLTR